MHKQDRLDIKSFSNFVSEINAMSLETDAEGLARWTVEKLSVKLGFEGAWYGWAQLEESGVQIHANASVNLPDDYFDFWQTVSEDDLLSVQLRTNPDTAATYDRASGPQNDGMTALADRYSLNKIATVMNRREGRLASFYISSYRTGKRASAFQPHEQEFLQCTVDQLGRAMKLSSSRVNETTQNGSISILANESGIGILGLGNLRDQLGDYWPGWRGDLLPETLRCLIARPGTHYLIDQKIVVTCEEAPKYQNMGLRRLTLRRMTAMDLLTNREREVAKLLADGRSHKEAAKVLGVAPSTIRNQTQAIYEKAGVNNRAELVSLIYES